MLDVELTVTDPLLSIGDIYTSAVGQDPGPRILVDGWPFRASDPIGVVPIRNGSRLVPGGNGPADPPGDLAGGQPTDDSATNVVRLTCVAGLVAGEYLDLPPGVHDVGGDIVDDPDRPLFRIEISDGPRLRRILPLPDRLLLADGEPVPEEGVTHAEVVQAESLVFRISIPEPNRRPALPVTDSGRVALRRQPRLLGSPAAEPPVKPRRPGAPREQGSFPWIMALAPIPIGLVAAFLFSPFFLVFMLMSPVLAGARWVDGKRRFKKGTAKYKEELNRVMSSYAAELRVWRATEGKRRRHQSPDLRCLSERAAAATPDLWERRVNHPDYLSVTLGYGDERVSFGTSGDDMLDTVSEHLNRLHTVPVVASLASEPAIGIVGPRDLRRQVAAALLIELAVTHGPSDLAIGLLVDGKGAGHWDWMKWLPHLDGGRGLPQVATELGDAVELLAAFADRDPSNDSGRSGQGSFNSTGPELPTPAPILLVDGHRFLDGRFTALSNTLRRNQARAIMLADDRESLPSVCSTVVALGPDGTATVQVMTTGCSHHGVVPVMLSPTRAAAVCRQLAPLSDPDRTGPAADLPKECDLRQLVGGQAGSTNDPDSVIDAGSVVDKWNSARPTLDAIIGVAGRGPVRVDLVDDGPHALIAGTTGSGKSELLRTLVASLAWHHSPEQLTFLLIDFKGGGAFDACGQLPHTVGVVTDLDEHLAARALRCLRAELRYREHRLREAGVNDIAHLGAHLRANEQAPLPSQRANEQGPLPRLVVVVDEFATLAAELPDFMNSLVDVAQRGRSLGIHLILATQRPAGVVDAKIRANTNLRIALRVQDDGDSIDVVGEPRAAKIDRRTPGRGYIRLGAGELAQFQTALVSRHLEQAADNPLVIRPFALTGAAEFGPTGGPADAVGTSDLQLLVEATAEACRLLDIGPPRVPWPAPLPGEIEAEELVGAIAGSADSADSADRGGSTSPFQAPLGLMDLPDQQETRVHTWSPDQGNLLVYGTDTSMTGAVIETLILGLARNHGPERFHSYVVDCSGSASLAALVRLPHVGAVVNLQEEERLFRVLDLVESELVTRSQAARQDSGASGTRKAKKTRVDDHDPDRPLIVLAISNYGTLAAYFEESNRYETSGRLERLVRDGPSVGIHVIISANHERSVPSRIAGQIESRLVMRMADPTAYLAFGFRTTEVVDLGPGRALLLPGGIEFQVARYQRGVSTVEGVELGSGARTHGPVDVSVLGVELPSTPFIGHSRTVRTGWDLVIGQRYTDLGPAALELRSGSNLLVSGRSGSGKTTALRALAGAARRADPSCQILVQALDDEEWPGSGFRPPQTLTVDDIDPDRRCLLLVDGLAALDEDLIKDLEGGSGQGRILDRLWIAIADRPEVLHGAPLWLRKLAGSQTGLFLQPSPDHADIVRVRLPIRAATDYPAGRGFLVTSGRPELIQVVNATPDEFETLADRDSIR